MTARRRAACSFAVTVLVLLALRSSGSDPATRREWALLVLLPLGYGHQLAAVAARRRQRAPARRVAGLAVVALVLSGAGFSWLLSGPAAFPLIAALAALAVWHVIENEVAMARVGSGRLAPLPRSPRHHAALLVATGCALLVACLAPRLAVLGLRLGISSAWCVWSAEELVAGSLLYHVVSFLIFRVAARPDGRRRGWDARVLVSHGLPLGVAVASLVWWPPLLALLASPPLYLYCSGVHALATLWNRGLEPA